MRPDVNWPRYTRPQRCARSTSGGARAAGRLIVLGVLLGLLGCNRTMRMQVFSPPDVNLGRPYYVVVEPSLEGLPPLTYDGAAAEVLTPDRSLYRQVVIPDGPPLELEFTCRRGRFVTFWMYYLVVDPLEMTAWRECVAMKCQRLETFIVGQQNGLTCDTVEKSQQTFAPPVTPDLSTLKAPDAKVPDVKVPGVKPPEVKVPPLSVPSPAMPGQDKAR